MNEHLTRREFWLSVATQHHALTTQEQYDALARIAHAVDKINDWADEEAGTVTLRTDDVRLVCRMVGALKMQRDDAEQARNEAQWKLRKIREVMDG